METHSGDSSINRFFSFWGAIASFLIFGVVVLLMVGLSDTFSNSESVESLDDQRRMELDTKTLAAQDALVNGWKKNEDGTIEVPASVALTLMKGKFDKPAKSSVPVPGTKAAEEAAKAAAAALTPAPTEDASAEGETPSNP